MVKSEATLVILEAFTIPNVRFKRGIWILQGKFFKNHGLLKEFSDFPVNCHLAALLLSDRKHTKIQLSVQMIHYGQYCIIKCSSFVV